MPVYWVLIDSEPVHTETVRTDENGNLLDHFATIEISGDTQSVQTSMTAEDVVKKHQERHTNTFCGSCFAC